MTFCNITLGYGLLALASSYQLAAVEMDFRVPDSGTDFVQSPAKSFKDSLTEEKRDTQNLLLASPLDIDKLIASTQTSRDFEPRALIRKLPDYSKPIQRVSPDHLRVLGEIISQIHARTQAVRAASQAIENRLDLENQELQRQIRPVKECSSAIAELRKSQTKMRAQEMMEKQGKLGERLDKVLVAMSAEYRPQIGEVERKWFDELERLKARIRGAGALRGKGLAGRAHVVSDLIFDNSTH